jgi:hypothetical protein
MTGNVNCFSLIAPVAHAPRNSNRGRSLTSQDALDSDTFLCMISPFRAECLNIMRCIEVLNRLCLILKVLCALPAKR